MKSFALATGSSGNSIYVESDKGIKILVDLGLSFKRTSEILSSRGIDVRDIDYVFITHEHSDHCYGLANFVKNVDARIYLTKGTFEGIGLDTQQFLQKKSLGTKGLGNVQFVENHEVVLVGDLKVFVVSKSHDSLDAVSYVFENGVKLGVFTDLGYVSNEIKHILKTLDIIYFEASYCDEIIAKRSLRYMYVNRLISDIGHMNTSESAKVLGEVCNSNQKIILSHISRNANTYENAYLKIKNHLDKLKLFPKIIVSFQVEPSEWVE